MSDQPQTLECPHDTDCGACALLGVDLPGQLRRKHRTLVNALEHYRRLAKAEVLPCLESPLLQSYRNRAKMAVGFSKLRPASVGYFRAGTREIVDAPDCQVLLPEILETTRALRDFFRRVTGLPRDLRHVDVRCGTDPRRQHLILVLRTDKEPRLPIDALRRACRWVNGMSINLNPSAGPQVLKGPIQSIWGEREVFVKSGGISLRVSPGSFFQANLPMLPKIHTIMGDFLRGGQVLADLYSGVGTHGLALRGKFRHVVFVEGVRIAVADTKATIERHRMNQGTSVIAKPVERGLKPLLEAEADSVIMNPSRAGAKSVVLETLARSAAEKIVYLSCDPKTLARDLDLLVRLGFRLISTQPIDMMPQTGQVEAIALLKRRGVGPR